MSCMQYCLAPPSSIFALNISVINIDGLVQDYKNPLHLDVVDRYLRRMGDKTIPDEAPPSLESFYPP